MSLIITNNPSSLYTLALNMQELLSSQMQLPSSSANQTIVNASNDIAGLVISEALQESSSGFAQAMQNANQGISMIQVATSGMNQTLTVLQQMQSMAVESASGIYSSTQLADIQTQFSQLQNEVNSIANSTQFNGVSLLQNSSGSIDILVGNFDTSFDTVTVPLNKTDTGTLGIATSNIGTVADASAAISAIGSAINTVTTDMSSMATAQTSLVNAFAQDSGMSANLLQASSIASNIDFASATSSLALSAILDQTNIALLTQANSTSNQALQLLSFG